MSNSITNNANLNIDSDSTSFNEWGELQYIRTDVFTNRVEILYKQYSNIIYNAYPPPESLVRVVKHIYTIKNKSLIHTKTCYGKIIPPQDEKYEFEEE